MNRYSSLLTILVLFLNACEQQEPMPTASNQIGDGLSTAVSKNGESHVLTSDNTAFRSKLVEINARLEKMGANYRVHSVEWLAAPTSLRVGQTIYANDRGNKQLDSHWVPGDPRRGGRFNITYLVDQSDGIATGGLTNDKTEPAIDRAMNTWEVNTECSNFEITKVTDSGTDPDFVDFFLGYGEWGTRLADITHAGWMPKEFFNAIEPGLGENLLGITYYFIWFNHNGDPTDIDGNGKADAAFREIYYNNGFAWAIDNWVLPNTFDVESVALHEAGHGLSQGHFGKIFVTSANNKLHFAPFAVMNALLSRVTHELEGTDLGGHCSIWGSWPNK